MKYVSLDDRVSDRSQQKRTVVIAVLLAAFRFSDAQALITVGPAADSACNFHDVSSAVVHAAQNPGADIVAITSGTWSAQTTLLINDTNDLTIEGGFANCSAGIASGRTRLDGTGASPTGPLILHGSTNHLTLINLDLAHGSGGFGGGVDSEGNGRLTLNNVQLIGNQAVYGGGIAAIGSGGAQKMVELFGVAFSSNTARGSGGGLYARLADVSIASGAVDNYFLQNAALGTQSDSGDGGAMYLADANLRVTAHGVSGGPIGFMTQNTAARNGGGVYADSSNASAHEVRFANDSATSPLRFNANSAVEGGLIYLKTPASANPAAYLHVDFVNALINGNTAADGIIYTNAAAPQTIIGIRLQTPVVGDAAPRCSAGLECNVFDANHASSGCVITLAGSATSGLPYIQFDHALLRHNTAPYALIFSDFGPIYIDASLIAANTVSSRFIASFSGDIHVATSTIAGNTFLAGEASVEILNAPGSLTLLRDLFVDAHPVCAVGSGVSVNARDSGVGNGGGSSCLPNDAGANIQYLSDPFVNAAAGDFHLLRYSSAVDRWASNDAANPPPAFDLDGTARPQTIATNTTTPFDFGAYEARPDIIFIDGFDGH